MLAAGGWFLYATWQNFFFMVGGAAAALTGLVFVAVAMHNEAITGHPLLREMAAGTLQLLVLVVVVCAETLIPMKSVRALGVVILTTVGCSIGVAIVLGLRALREHGELAPLIRRRAPFAFAAMTLVETGSVLLTAHHTGGLYFIAPGILVAMVFALVNGWFLLATVGRDDAARHLHREKQDRRLVRAVLNPDKDEGG